MACEVDTLIEQSSGSHPDPGQILIVIISYMVNEQQQQEYVASGFSQMRILVSFPIFFPDHLTKLSNIFTPKPHITTVLVYCGPEVHLLN